MLHSQKITKLLKSGSYSGAIIIADIIFITTGRETGVVGLMGWNAAMLAIGINKTPKDLMAPLMFTLTHAQAYEGA